MFSPFKKFGSVLGLLALSQALNAVSLLLIPVVLDARWADSFALGLQVGTSAYGGVVLGVVYNVAIGRPYFRHWRRSALLSGLFSVFLGTLIVIAATNLSASAAASDPTQGVVVAIFALGGAGLAVSGTGAVRDACNARPERLSGINLVPATALLIGFGLVWGAQATPLLPAIAWSTFAWLQVPYFWNSRTSNQRAVETDPTVPRLQSASGIAPHAISLSVGVVASTVVPAFLIAALTQLPSGSTALTFVVVRIATSIVGIGVNSLLLVRYNWQSEVRSIQRPSSFLASMAALIVSSSVVLSLSAPEMVAVGVAVIGWVVLLIGAALNLRETNARRLTRAIAIKVAIDVSASIVGCILLFAHPSVASYFGLLLLSQSITMLVTSAFLGYRLAAVASALSLAGSVYWVINPMIS